MRKVKAFFKLVFDEGIKGSYARVIIATLAFAVLAIIFECAEIFDGTNYPNYMHKVFTDSLFNRDSFADISYHLVLYAMIAAYGISAVYICLKKQDISWCGLVIVISLIFIVVVNVYLTIFFQYSKIEEDGSYTANFMMEMYKALTTCCISFATIISSIAGIKMTFLFRKNKDGFVPCENVELVTINNEETEIAENAFKNCVNMKSIILGKNLKVIGDSAFDGCNNLENVFYMGCKKEDIHIISRNNAVLEKAKWRFYCDDEKNVPSQNGDYWHFDSNGLIAIWLKEE